MQEVVIEGLKRLGTAMFALAFILALSWFFASAWNYIGRELKEAWPGTFGSAFPIFWPEAHAWQGALFLFAVGITLLYLVVMKSFFGRRSFDFQ
ncbi:MAG: hypothetical protein Q7S03_04110 [bacterium]|nr:hypothetical protein [bacterium]